MGRTGRLMVRYRIRQALRAAEEFVAPDILLTGVSARANEHDKMDVQAREIVDRFHELYYLSPERTWGNTFWFGVPTLKCPLDLWIYQEILNELRPDLIIETGTAQGGSALFLATICDQLGNGSVVTIDITEWPGRPEHPRIAYLLGSSTDKAILEAVRSKIRPNDTVVAILDADHGKTHVLKELRAYSQLVTSGSYLIVEDTNMNGHPVMPEVGPGPMEAVEQFLKERSDFEIDPNREKLYLSFNPRGYLRKLRPER